jgi:hypothetical protein
LKIDKPIVSWTEQDLELLRDDPYNLEDMYIEYKLTYNNDPDELRKDVISFANSATVGYILFGIKDDPFDLIGLSRTETDKLKNTIVDVIHSHIDPRLDPPPVMHPIALKTQRYVLGIEIFPKQRGIYAIRKINNPNKPDYLRYSFWVRSDGRKRQLSMEEVNEYIIKTDPFSKFIEVSLNIGLIQNPNKEPIECISVSGVNKSIRPIVFKNNAFLILNKEKDEWYSFWLPPPSYKFPSNLNTRPNTKLLDGDSCSSYYPTSYLKKDLESKGIILPTLIKGIVNTNDGRFYTKEMKLTENGFFHIIKN